MTRKTPKKPTSPTLQLHITEENREKAIASNSGGCLIADAIKEQYPQLSGISVDMATIRVTDKAKGLRFVYLTPSSAQHLLLSFDQGWPNPTEDVTIRRAVHISKVKAASKSRAESTRQRRQERKTELEAKVASGLDLTPGEKRALTIASKPYEPAERPATYGPTEVDVPANGPVTRVGGRPAPQGPAHPNLLRSRNRHFGAKLADPGKAWEEALEAAIAERMKDTSSSSPDE